MELCWQRRKSAIPESIKVVIIDMIKIIGIIVFKQILIDLFCHNSINFKKSLFSYQLFPFKVIFIGKTRAFRKRFTDITLKTGNKIFITFTGNNGQNIGLMYRCRVIPAFTKAVKGNTKTTTNVLTAGDGVITMLESAS